MVDEKLRLRLRRRRLDTAASEWVRQGRLLGHLRRPETPKEDPDSVFTPGDWHYVEFDRTLLGPPTMLVDGRDVSDKLIGEDDQPDLLKSGDRVFIDEFEL